MTKDAAYYREYRAANREQLSDQARVRRTYRPTQHSTRPFVGVDGEGGNIAGPTGEVRHEYLLLRAGTETLHTGLPLSPMECLRFLSSLPPEPIYVGYFFDYDVTMILRDLPAGRVRRILDRQGRTTDGYTAPLPVDVGPYQVDYLPHKYFRVRRKGAAHWVTVSDVGSFFQCSFVTALTQWDIGTPEQRADIATGKDLRAGFADLDAETDAYNALEIDLLEQLMHAFRDVCQDVGYTPRQWQGPGNVASAMLSRHHVPKREALDLPRPVVEAAAAAFYGGRFETTTVGECGPVHQYDINSAYPHALTQVPCLVHGTWDQADEWSPFGLEHVRFNAHEPANLYGMPIRAKDGSISYPAAGQGWYWTVETQHAYHQDLTVLDRWWYRKRCACEPFGFIPDVYAERLALGKTARGKVLKIALNSLYGKTCQSVGTAPYANPVWASLITALTRTQLAEVAHGGPDCCTDVHMLATDGIFCGPRPITPDKALGGWDLATHDSLFIIQPGLYLTPEHDQPKTRGIPRQVVVDNASRFREAYREGLLSGTFPGITVPVRQFIGLRIAHARGKPSTAGNWVTSERTVTFDVSTKRQGLVLSEGRVRSRPLDGGLETVPYSKDIGRALAELRLAAEDAPDWADIMYGDEL